MYSEEELEAINDGQRKINGALCFVDYKLISILKAVRDLLANTPAIRADLTQIDKALEEARTYSKQVADIKPPGCEPPPW